MIKKNLLLVSLLTVSSTMFSTDSSGDSCCKLNRADESKKTKKQEDLTKLIDMLFNKDDMLKMFNKSFEQMAKFMPANQTKKSKDLVKSMTTKVAEKMTSSSFKCQFAKIYDDNFNSEEITDLVNFYNSKTGKRFIEKMPEVAAESAKISGEMMQEIMAEAFTDLQEDTCDTCSEKDAKKSVEDSEDKN